MSEIIEHLKTSLKTNPATVELLTKSPVLSIMVACPGLDLNDSIIPDSDQAKDVATAIGVACGLGSQSIEMVGGPMYRAVAPDRLVHILRFGFDKDSTSDPLWVATTPRKALGYGKRTKQGVLNTGPRVLQVFDAAKLIRPANNRSHEYNISGDPWDTLRALFMVGEDPDITRTEFQKALESIQ